MEIMVQRHLGLRVGEIMAERGLSSYRLAEMTGLNYNTIRSIANDHYDRVGLRILEALCDALDVTPGELFRYTNEIITTNLIDNGPKTGNKDTP